MIEMKILVCASEYYPYGSGIANVAYNVVEQLKKMGVDCTVCSPTGPDIKLGSSKLIEKTGILGLLYYWHQVANYFKGNRYDAVWLHNPLFIKNPPFKNSLATMNSTAYGQVIHKIYPLHLLIYKTIASKIEKYCLNKMKETRFIGVGTNICEELEEIGIAKQRITYIPNGVNTERFTSIDPRDKKILRQKFDIPENAILILSVGRLTEVKQPLELVYLFSLIENSITNNISLVIAGTGKMLDKTKTFAQKKGIKNIKFLGYVAHLKDIFELYACSDVYILTSKYEGGQPLTLLEAMASGLPAIVTNIPNPSTIVKDADCGIIINLDNKEKSAQQIIGYLESTELLEHSKNARKYVLNNFNWKLISERYLEEFKKLC